LLVKALQVLQAHASSPAERLSLLTKIGEVYGERMHDPRQSFAAFCKALKEFPGDLATLGRLEMLSAEHGRYPELVALLLELASGNDDTELARALWLKSAQLYDVQLGDEEGAISAYSQILNVNAGDMEVLEALESLYRRKERWKELLGVLRRRGEFARDEE